MNSSFNTSGIFTGITPIALMLAWLPQVFADTPLHQHLLPTIPAAVPVTADFNSISASTAPTRRTIQAAATTLGQPAVFGQWSVVDDWPVLAVHANLLPNGKVLAWDATPDDFDEDPHTAEIFTTRVTLWDPVTNTHRQTNNDTNSDLFCAGSAHLWDGRVLFAGGDSGRNGSNGPLMNTSVYEPDTNSWRQVTNMAAPRWYSSVASLGNGELLTYAGSYFPDPIAEVFQLNETWRTLASVTETEGLSVDYQWMQSTPDGNVMTFGPQNTLATIQTSGNGQLMEGPQRDDFPERRYGSYAMYDVGRVLVSGGTEKDGGDTSYRSAVIIDTATNQTTDTSPMIYRRTQHNLTILADGSVLATGGNSDGAKLISMDAGIYRPEIWSPETGQWREMNDMQVNRQYHSIALLLPDGRVLSAGGGYCGDCLEVGYEEQNAEIFSPPYLFAEGDTPAIRPLMGGAPDTVDYADVFPVATDQAASIARVHLIKLGAVTHSQNQDQRLVPLAFTISSGALQLTAPDNRYAAPPGHYLLYLVNDAGVPSQGHIIKLGQPLLTSGQAVSKPVAPNQTDEFVINSNPSDKALKVTVSSTVSNNVNNNGSSGRLLVTGVADNGTNTATCDMAVAANTATDCRLENNTGTRWKIRFTASADTTYNLVADLSQQTDPLAIPAPPETEVPDTGSETGPVAIASGGGSVGFLHWLFLPLVSFRILVLNLKKKPSRA
jgi:hypothetical protein